MSKNKEKTLFDYYEGTQFISNGKEKTKEINNNSEKINKLKKSEIKLIRNPSKQGLKTNNNLILNNNEGIDYKNKILINEDFVDNLKLLLEPFITKIKISVNNTKSNLDITNDEYELFINNNINNIISKFILHLKGFIFIPKSFMNKNSKIVDKAKTKLIEGFDNTKFISLQYHGLNSHEVFFYLFFFR